MTDKYEYGEPWNEWQETQACSINDCNEIDVFTGEWPEPFRNIQRIVAAVNACAGIPQEQLEWLGTGGVAELIEALEPFALNTWDNDTLERIANIGNGDVAVINTYLTPNDILRARELLKRLEAANNDSCECYEPKEDEDGHTD